MLSRSARFWCKAGGWAAIVAGVALLSLPAGVIVGGLVVVAVATLSPNSKG